MKRIIVKSMLLCAAGFFGAWIFVVAFPIAVEKLPFISRIGFIPYTLNGTTVVRETKEFIIDKAEAFPRATERAASYVVSVERVAKGAPQAASSGIIVTSDGWVVAPASIVVSKGEYRVVRRGELIPATLVRTDKKLNIALFAIDMRNLPVPEFVNSDNYALGSSVIALGARTAETFENAVEVSYIARLTASSIGFPEGFMSSLPSGASVFTIEGKFIGMGVHALGVWSLVRGDDMRAFISASQSGQ